jgi:endonuclease YncB( thermonuclease family)
MKMFSSLLLVLALNCADRAISETLTGKVVSVVDGDTITVLDAGHGQHRIRLVGIDAPEKSQAYGQRSKESLSEMVFGKTVSIQWDKKDRYGRLLGKVQIGSQDINLDQLIRGYAWHYKQYQMEQNPRDRERYAAAESAARAAKTGLWNEVAPTAPWDYRHHKLN